MDLNRNNCSEHEKNDEKTSSCAQSQNDYDGDTNEDISCNTNEEIKKDEEKNESMIDNDSNCNNKNQNDEQKNEKKLENEKQHSDQSEEKNIGDIRKLQDEINQEKDKYMRLFAEFQNFRTRTEKEKIDMYDIGASSAISKILPVVDNIERALSQVPDELKNNSFVDGIDKVYKQIMKIFEELDVKQIEAKGKSFDSNLHNAVMTDEEADVEVDIITEELLKGYTYKQQVLRHSMVKVKK